ncbi:addiction module antidote protein, HigA family (plasmid) [Azospirillum brasilense]|jgi:addiction module HigA family antidote|uniref:Addiction module antidote protein, HigA family n=1 Tax=Azospirillum brasilense TaxID=192 RepID=A0A4D8QPK6_AZOBR|nr:MULTISPECIES: HigA family addiction module antitoxin [Azospirillum]YP_001686898.1 plasmid antitoxin with HTH domain [Azospirillum phage Cd]MDW7555359.1 HigA family addiction module antitoxin [Azospirillum brasilense]MDW7595233.1 HigA family addiction module antitoxin [Azospirillum brasilense]MDW7630387.1 HigA family addiction module antitoxin [Azospirillum brasilense]MDX5949754.1 HigA family addiction module antitoxin [Azospirillum brasilense]OPH16884.1 hypothetical protein FE89_02700 [Azo
MTRVPTHPGKFIANDVLQEYGLTQQELADMLKVSRLTINELAQGKRSVTPGMALRLEKLTGQSAEFWMRLQNMYDLAVTRMDMIEALQEIEPLDGTDGRNLTEDSAK